MPGSLLISTEFPRIEFSGNSSRCIKTAATAVLYYYRSLLVRILGSGLPSNAKR